MAVNRSWLVKGFVGLGVAGVLGGVALAAHFGLPSGPSHSGTVSQPSAPPSAPASVPASVPASAALPRPSALPSSPVARPSVGLPTSPSRPASAAPSTRAPSRPAPPNPANLPVAPNTEG